MDRIRHDIGVVIAGSLVVLKNTANVFNRVFRAPTTVNVMVVTTVNRIRIK